MYVNILLFAYVRGVASALEAETQAERDTGLTSDEWMETQDAALRSMLTSGAPGDLSSDGAPRTASTSTSTRCSSSAWSGCSTGSRC